MKNINTRLPTPKESHQEKFSQTETILLKWIELIIALVCFVVLIYILFLCPSSKIVIWHYTVLIAMEMVILLAAIVLYEKDRVTLSSNLLILAGIIGPWWSVIFDESIINGNLFPLVYTTIPILFSSFFSPVAVTIIIGISQCLGVATIIYLGEFDLGLGAASLFFFVVFIFAISLIINIQNRNNRQTISAQVERLEEFANHDPLTGMLNRRFPFEFLQKEFARLKREEGIVSIVIFDVDDFKYFNDTYGHDCGDDILISISKLLLSNFRESDVCCRYGGDEFLIAMSGAKLEEAKKRVENLQRKITEEKFKSLSDEKKKVTISVGIAAYPIHGETVNDVIKAADQALYQAKEKGKNRIEIIERK